MVNSTPDTAESEAPTAPFPAVSHILSRFGTPEPEDQTTSGESKEKEDETTQRAFGSPIPIDEDIPLCTY